MSDFFLASALKLREAADGQVIIDTDDKSLKHQSKASGTFIAPSTNMVDVELTVSQILEFQAPIRDTPSKNGQRARG